MKYNIKHFFRKIYFNLTRGFDCCDAVGANYWIAEKIIPILQHMRDHTYSYPMGLTIEKWHSILDDIIAGFQANIDIDEVFDSEEEKKLARKIDKGLKLFAKYYADLWI